MSFLGDIFGSVLSLFGANKARQQAKDDGATKFIDLRNSATAAGFNPLTALMATGGAGFGAYPSSAPPLASVELLTGALGKAGDVLSGDVAARRETDRLNLDLARIRVDEARGGVALAPRTATAFGSGPRLGRNTATVVAGPPEMRKINMFVDVYNPLTGNTFRYPNPDLTDAGPMEMGTAAAGLAAAETGSVAGVAAREKFGPSWPSKAWDRFAPLLFPAVPMIIDDFRGALFSERVAPISPKPLGRLKPFNRSGMPSSSYKVK